jgi:hypothetical protein
VGTGAVHLWANSTVISIFTHHPCCQLP